MLLSTTSQLTVCHNESRALICLEGRRVRTHGPAMPVTYRKCLSEEGLTHSSSLFQQIHPSMSSPMVKLLILLDIIRLDHWFQPHRIRWPLCPLFLSLSHILEYITESVMIFIDIGTRLRTHQDSRGCLCTEQMSLARRWYNLVERNSQLNYTRMAPKRAYHLSSEFLIGSYFGQRGALRKFFFATFSLTKQYT